MTIFFTEDTLCLRKIMQQVKINSSYANLKNFNIIVV